MNYNILKELLKPSLLNFDSDSTGSSSDSYPFDDDFDEPSNKKNRTEYPVDVSLYSDNDFRNNFRITKETFRRLSDEIVDKNYIGGGSEISKDQAILITLFYLSNNETFRTISDRFNISTDACYTGIKRIITLLNQQSESYITWPHRNMYKTISDAFNSKKRLPYIIGAIGSKHIRISKPKDYLNKKRYSFRLQAVVDHQKLFTNIHCGEPGSLNAFETLRNSNLYQRVQTENILNKFYIIGNETYQTNWIVTPFKRLHLTEQQKDFNSRLKSTQSVVTDALTLLKGRFRRLNKFENRRIDFIVSCVIAAMVLHNICIISEDDQEFEDDDRDEDVNDRNEDINDRDEDVNDRDEDVNDRNEDINDRDEDVNDRNEDVNDRDEDVNDRSEDVNDDTDTQNHLHRNEIFKELYG